jgi:hypothetical protein
MLSSRVGNHTVFACTYYTRSPLIFTHSCRPIYAYQGLDTLLLYATDRSHIVQVYTESKPPFLSHKISNIEPIRVMVKNRNDKTSLPRASCLDVIRLKSVEFRYPVAEVGKISREDLERVIAYTLEHLKSEINNDDDYGDIYDDDDEQLGK